MREVTLPSIEKGLAASGRKSEEFEVSYPLFVVTGQDEREWQTMRGAVAKQVAFYGSTPAYRPVLDCHGWGDLQTELNVLSKRGEWDAMGERISDDVLNEFAVVAEPEKVAGAIISRFGDLVSRVSCDFSFVEREKRSQYIEEIQAR